MSNTKTSAENAAAALDGTEIIRGVQAGANVKLTVNQVVDRVSQGITANRDYYVRTDGNDSNTGLSNTPSGAFLTVQKAVLVAGQLVVGAYAVVIHVGAGNFPGLIVAEAVSSSSTAYLSYSIIGAGIGVTTIATGSYTGFNASGSRTLVLLQNLTVGSVASRRSAYVQLTNVRCQSRVQAMYCGSIYVDTAEFDNVANDITAVSALAGGIVELSDYVFIGTPSFSYASVWCSAQGLIYLYGTGTGAPVGKRFLATTGGVIDSYGAGVNAIPGTIAGTVDTGGQYV